MPNDRESGERTGSELQQSQSGGASGLFGGNRNQQQGGQSRGERFDEEQGGGRDADSISAEDGGELARDQAEHQDRGQSAIEFEKDRS